MAEELETWRMALSREMEVGFWKGSPGSCGEGEAAGMALPAAGSVPVFTVTTSLCVQEGMEATFLGVVYSGVPGPAERSEGRGGGSRLQGAAPGGV